MAVLHCHGHVGIRVTCAVGRGNYLISGLHGSLQMMPVASISVKNPVPGRPDHLNIIAAIWGHDTGPITVEAWDGFGGMDPGLQHCLGAFVIDGTSHILISGQRVIH